MESPVITHANNGIATASTCEHFYVGGTYVGAPGAEIMSGQMYVEVWRPAKVSKPYPLVLIHGTGQTATNWMTTPDGRSGWVHFFNAQGYVVYLVDQPGRGRSAWHAQTNGVHSCVPVWAAEKYFTASHVLGDWPQAARHTQWPGKDDAKGRKGDPYFDAFFAAQVDFIRDPAETQRLFQAAAAALLDKIGPAILITHSQSGPFGWLVADIRPELVKAIVALEPQGPPVVSVSMQKSPSNDELEHSDTVTKPWGITDIALTYDPPLVDGQALQFFKKTLPQHSERISCWLQTEPARLLPNLLNTPVLIVTGEASYHAIYDHGTHEYLVQAGVPSTHLRLEDEGILGNGHMMMLEKNNLVIAARLDEWISQI